MKFIGSFFQFAERVVRAAREGQLPPGDIRKLDRLLRRTGTRNLILAKGLLSALHAGGAKPEDTERLARLLETATERIARDKEPFTASEKRALEDIFSRAYLSKKAAHWFASQMDELLAEEIDEFITGRRMLTVPAKKTVDFETAAGKKKEKLIQA